MLICQWHLDIVYGKQGDAVRAMRRSIGPAYLHEYSFESLADFEADLASIGEKSWDE